MVLPGARPGVQGLGARHGPVHGPGLEDSAAAAGAGSRARGRALAPQQPASVTRRITAPIGVATAGSRCHAMAAVACSGLQPGCEAANNGSVTAPRCQCGQQSDKLRKRGCVQPVWAAACKPPASKPSRSLADERAAGAASGRTAGGGGASGKTS